MTVKKTLLIIMVFMMAGCITYVSDPLSPQTTLPKQKALTNFHKVSLGMSIQEVVEIMGRTLRTGYVLGDDQSQSIEEINIPAPVEAETITGGGKEYEVFYYVTQVSIPDGVFNGDELMPLIFENGKLIGKDWKIFYQLIDK